MLTNKNKQVQEGDLLTRDWSREEQRRSLCLEVILFEKKLETDCSTLNLATWFLVLFVWYSFTSSQRQLLTQNWSSTLFFSFSLNWVCCFKLKFVSVFSSFFLQFWNGTNWNEDLMHIKSKYALYYLYKKHAGDICIKCMKHVAFIALSTFFSFVLFY